MDRNSDVTVVTEMSRKLEPHATASEALWPTSPNEKKDFLRPLWDVWDSAASSSSGSLDPFSLLRPASPAPSEAGPIFKFVLVVVHSLSTGTLTWIMFHIRLVNASRQHRRLRLQPHPPSPRQQGDTKLQLLHLKAAAQYNGLDSGTRMVDTWEIGFKLRLFWRVNEDL